MSDFSIVRGLGLMLLTVAVMEGVAYVAHRWIMHGFLWSLHRSHHEARKGVLEINDWFAVMGALPAIALIFMGSQLGMGLWLMWVGIGITVYGMIYFGFHDVIVHRRVVHRYIPKSAYMKRIVQAHRLHHAVESKHHGLSFGFLVAPPLDKLMLQLEHSKGRLREPARRSA